ncbi:MAG: efflux RND transporter periplasmic adaptor subunit [Candidatus Scalindua rubra]|uniref:Multicomponent efflux pump (Periplasmic accessory protein subunit, RND type ABC transporters) n=1 Tax=Candidatus Scalindua brodae TaxID=237368 RepID=A0A0B0EEE7_9BACT|nr:MAG: multicomponent efflux pump (periplasmic accessory protein subunit, RND type ABC transporters) [Candidatus Scalindua brodae]MBZ0109590.1 efflux RND transporter periplasmic adaptor subunit [Candidatus Scalindua rubra]TWU33156.1 Antibiotic efflux pump periplasmic linker protein ArpA precursor [Candidatus Brocadiaceae bacterium S225]
MNNKTRLCIFFYRRCNSAKIILKNIIIPITLSCVFTLTGCGKKEITGTGPSPRPVNVIELSEINPVKPLQLTGSVMSWKEQDISFEVSGRVEWIVEMGTNLEGRWEEDGIVHVPGDVMARIDKRHNQIRLKAVRAEKERAQAEYVRKKQAWDKKAISEVDFIRATADRDSSEAQFEQADYDLDKCTLYAPFPGEVSEVYIEAGGYAQKGNAVLHLVMMDPIKVDISVSAKTAESLKLRDSVRLFLPGNDNPVIGRVYEKSTVADPETRTFRVSIITRNRQQIGELLPGDPLLMYPRITDYLYLQQLKAGDADSPFFVEENRALHSDGVNYYVWGDPDHKYGDDIDPDKPLITLRKFTVIPGEHRMNLQGLYLMRELDDIGKLTPGTLIAMDVPDDFKDGEQILVARRQQWRLRPGQLIPVLLGATMPETGFYLPINSIKPVNDKTGEIFVAVDGKAKKVKVQILSNVGELFRIEALDPGNANLVTTGSRVITDHIHFLEHDEPVRVIKTVEMNP